MLHELGHVYDLTVLSNRDRGEFRQDHAQAAPQWWKGKVPLAEWFAEAYSWCARYSRIVSVDEYAIYDYDPTPAQHRSTCSLIKRAARDNTPPKPPPAPPVVTGDPAPPAAPPVAPAVGARATRRAIPGRPCSRAPRPTADADARRRRRPAHADSARRTPTPTRPRHADADTRRRRPDAHRRADAATADADARPRPSRAHADADGDPRGDRDADARADRGADARPPTPPPQRAADAWHHLGAWTGRCSGGRRCCRR